MWLSLSKDALRFLELRYPTGMITMQFKQLFPNLPFWLLGLSFFPGLCNCFFWRDCEINDFFAKICLTWLHRTRIPFSVVRTYSRWDYLRCSNNHALNATPNLTMINSNLIIPSRIYGITYYLQIVSENREV